VSDFKFVKSGYSSESFNRLRRTPERINHHCHDAVYRIEFRVQSLNPNLTVFNVRADAQAQETAQL
jgi:hypothetical protein